MMTMVFLLILLFVCLVMPFGFAWRIWKLDEATRAAWLAVVAESSVFVALIMLVGRWDIAGAYTRFVLLALVAAAIVVSWRRHRARPWRAAQEPALWRSHWSTLLSLVLFCVVLAYVATGLLPRQDARSLAFPLEGGRFMVGQGGNNALLNHHRAHRAQRYAADISAIDAAGFRAAGILPRDPARYAIFGAAVVSPCDGEVVNTRDGLPDLNPPAMDPENAAGNTIVIACEGMLVELAHLQSRSVDVATGDRLMKGQRIARVGNSGNTTEPHLHVHAVDAGSGEGVPLAFDGVSPVRNRLFIRP